MYPFQAEGLSPLLWQKLRLPMGDSSISVRIACRSSVAETTGKRITSRHARAIRHWIELTLRRNWTPFEFRHSQQAGKASSNHARLSSSSTRYE
jgi:hypothetical protein